MKTKHILLALIILIVSIPVSVYAVDHSDCYDLFWFYGGWSYNNQGKIYINYKYTKLGSYDYT